MSKAILITPLGERKEITPQNGTDFQLDEIYSHLSYDGPEVNTFELVHLHDGRYMLIDEEGKLKKEPVINPIATAFYLQGRSYYSDMIVGNVIICDSNMVL